MGSDQQPTDQDRWTRPTEVAQHCDSCGGVERDLAALHRVYVTPAAWDAEERIEVVAEVERWCGVCRSHYPHQELAADPG